MEGHVDDSWQLINRAGIEKYNRENGMELSLAEGAQQASQGFKRYLTLTGGRLEIEKTISYLLQTIRNGSRMEFQKKIDTPNVLEIPENF